MTASDILERGLAPDTPAHALSAASPDLDLLDEIQRRVLWLAVRMVDSANRERDTGDGVKVGGHMASSASLVSVMTTLWMAHLDAEDRVAVKPHASPVLHALNYLLGDLDRSYLTRLREFGGLQAYPSRTKDPDRVDFSTGSVGLGPAATLFAAATRRYVDDHFGPRPHTRFISLLGDAELDEGNIWEAIADPATAGLGTVMWVVDVNRQSLDRVVPGIRIAQWRSQFEAAGWHVVELKYGRRLRALMDRTGGEALRAWIDAMPNEHYQSMFGMAPPDVRARFLQGAPPQVEALTAELADADLAELVCDLGGHDLADLLGAYADCDAVTDRPSVVFAYTIKGWGLPLAGNPRNHSMLLTAEQIDAFRSTVGLSASAEWDRGSWQPGDASTSPGGGPRNPRRSSSTPMAATAWATGRWPRRRHSAGSSSTSPATHTWRRCSSRPRRMWPRPRASRASSTGLGSTHRTSNTRGMRTRCCAGTRAPLASTSSWGSAR
jgi:pyruvate dehydrogenase E1 component